MSDTKPKASADAPAPAAEAPAASADPRDLEIAALKAQLIVTSAASAVAANAAATNTVVPTPPTVDVPLVAKYDSLTKQVQALPQATWDLLSEEDQKRFTPYVADKPADLPTA